MASAQDSIEKTVVADKSLITDESLLDSGDEYVWLEDVEGEKSLDWVRQRNEVSQTSIQSDPQFTTLENDLLTILDSDQRIPNVSKHGEYYYNFWRDKEHPRGVWRRTTMDEYRGDDPQWDVILDLDKVAADEGENWVWAGSDLLRPNYDLALIDLSRGGADASVTREFDMTTRKFVNDGFERQEAKGGMGWIDRDHVYIQTDFGNGSMTSSGYPMIAKRWKRGTPIESAQIVFEGSPTDMSIGAYHDDTPGFERNFVRRAIAFYNDELYYLPPASDSASVPAAVQIDIPNSANKSVRRQYMLIEPRDPWTVGDVTYPSGSLLITLFDDYMAGKREFNVLFEPTDTTALQGWSMTKDYLVLNILSDVKNRIEVLQAQPPEADGQIVWKRFPLAGQPEFGTVGFSAIDSDESNEFFMTSTDYLTPTTLSIGTINDGAPEQIKSLPAFFDSSPYKIAQRFAESADGTRVPYFMVSAKEIEINGDNPTLLYGYGGFEISLLPSYSASVGKGWLEKGGVYVVANIRGGGEYGPRWHQAALRENRLRAYEDFAAVAEDLINSGVTSSSRLGIQGGSNGGLLVGNMVTLYPKLFAAAVCQVPLLDMKRYHKLLAGASWMAEYGNPDVASDWEFIERFSPYQNVNEDTEYPAVLFMTSTRDDRVHPGHARKMMAKMLRMGHDVMYFENIEGGHGGAANNSQRARMQALAYTYLRQRLMNETAP